MVIATQYVEGLLDVPHHSCGYQYVKYVNAGIELMDLNI